MKRLVVGLLAHVDSGKTTLAEGLLYRAGVLRKLGRVDHRDAFLDTDSRERARGITIFAKQAVLALPAAEGAEAPFDILPAVWISSAVSVAVGLLAARAMEKSA